MSSTNHNSSAKAILYAFIANLGIAIAKLGAAFYTGSGSLLAESIHFMEILQLLFGLMCISALWVIPV